MPATGPHAILLVKASRQGGALCSQEPCRLYLLGRIRRRSPESSGAPSFVRVDGPQGHRRMWPSAAVAKRPALPSSQAPGTVSVTGICRVHGLTILHWATSVRFARWCGRWCGNRQIVAEETPSERKIPPDLSRLADRLADEGLSSAGKSRSRGRAHGTALGGALKVSSEMIAGIAVGGGAGWLLDDWLDTSPALLMICVGLGFAAGLRNVLRAAHRFGVSEPDRGPFPSP